MRRPCPTSPVADSADRFADLVRRAADAKAVRVAQRRRRLGVELDERQREAMGEEGRNAADGADLALDVDTAKHCLRSRHRIPGSAEWRSGRWNFSQISARKPVAAAQPQPMRALARVLRRVERDSGTARRYTETACSRNRTTSSQKSAAPRTCRGSPPSRRRPAPRRSRPRRRCCDTSAGSRTCGRAGPRLHQAGEPEGPLQQPVVADHWRPWAGRWCRTCRSVSARSAMRHARGAPAGSSGAAKTARPQDRCGRNRARRRATRFSRRLREAGRAPASACDRVRRRR